MIGPYTFPALGASLVLAVAGGIQLGESAISLINPIHFQGPAIHPRDRGAAIDPNRVTHREPAFASLYGWDEGHSAHAADCGDCEVLNARDSYAYRYAYADPAPVRIAEEAWEPPVAADEGYDGTGGPEEAPVQYEVIEERVERYAYYPVEEDEVDEADIVYEE